MLALVMLFAAVQWQAKWIGAPEGVNDQAFGRQFAVTRPVKAATLHVTGLGFYEVYLNGKKIGDKVLDPSPTDYQRRVYYSSYRLDALPVGTNTLAVLLGHGWYDLRSHASWNFNSAPWRDRPKAIAQLEIDFADGTREIVSTDRSWNVVESPVVYDCLREGEVQDGRKRFGRALGVKAVEVAAPKGRLESGEGFPAAKKHEAIRPECVKDLGGGRWLVTFPETVSGWVRVAFRGLGAGDVVSLRHDENLGEDGGPAKPAEGDWKTSCHEPGMRAIDCFFKKSGDDPDGKRVSHMQVDRYIASGVPGETFEPHFVYHGFRHVLIEGLRERLSADDIQAVAIRTDFGRTGSFRCSDAKLTELVRMAGNSYVANFTDGVPTDCPHREKLGWTGDGWIASETGLGYFDVLRPYRKWYRDILDTQLQDGSICSIAPTSCWGYKTYAGPVFDAVIGMLPWNLWRFCGDREIVDTAYPALVRYLAYEKSLEKTKGLVSNGLGDWNALVMAHMPEKEYVVSCLYLRLKEIAAEFAALKGLAAEAQTWRESAEETRRALRVKYRTGEGKFANGGQTAQALAIEMNLCAPEERDAAAKRLVASVENTGCHVDFGLVGSKFVYRALSEIGRADLAYRMIVNPTEPSMTKWIGKNGTLWEDWDIGFSKCHVMLSDFAAWCQQYVAGLRRPLAPGYEEVLIAPAVMPGMTWAEGETMTPRGRLATSWKKSDGRFELKVTVPPGTKAEVRLIDGSVHHVGHGSRVFTAAACVPPPRPVKTPYRIGAFYYPGWDSMSEWNRVRKVCPERKPLLGWYDEANPEVVDWQIKWAVENGISYFLVDWYWDCGARRLGHWLKAYSKARYRDSLEWAVMWANHNDPGAHSEADQRRVTETWLRECFTSPRYLKVRGMPVVAIWKAELMVRDVGREGTRRLLELSREMARKAGYPGVWFVAVKFPEPDASRECLSRYAELGFDATCLYHYKDDGSGGKTPKRYPFSAVVDSSRSFWEKFRQNSSLPFPIPVSTGWDDRPWLDLFEIHGRTPGLFRKLCAEAKAFADETGNRDILLGPLNEWGEGSYIEPNEEHGFAMYEAVRDTFVEKPSEGWPKNLKPSDVGLGPYDLTDCEVPRIGDVDFTAGKVQGWRIQMGCRNEMKFGPEGLSFRTSTKDPALAWDVAPFRAEEVTSIVVSLSAGSACGKAQLFWTHAGEKANEARSLRVPVPADGAFHDLVFDVAANPHWKGEIATLRLDPGESPDVEIRIRSVKVTKNGGR